MAQNGNEAPLAIVHGPPQSEEPGQGPHTLPAFLAEVVRRHGPREALVMHHDDGRIERWSYDELNRQAHAVARALIACGIGKGERVGILMTNRPEWVSACFGIALAGGTVVGLSTFSTAEELSYLLKASACSTVLFERQVLAKDFAAVLTGLEPAIATASAGRLASDAYPFLRRLVMVGEGAGGGAIESWEAFLARGAGVDDARVAARGASVTPADPALLFFSSGSTGKPKGILNSNRGVNIQSWRYPRIYAFEAAHPVRSWSPNGLFWSGNFSLGLGGTLAGGGTMVLQSTFDPGSAIRLMEAERVSLPYCWPHQWAQLEADPAWADADLSAFYYFDAERNIRRPQASITTGWQDPRASYGSTETFTISTSYPVDVPREWQVGNFGPPLPGNTVRIVDPETGATLRMGETGEIAVKGPTLMIGYVGVPPELAFDEAGYYRSGDGGHIDERGRLVFSGRINDIIKTGGANVSPVEVDWALGACPGVKICKTTGVPDPALGEKVVSLIVPEPGHTLDPAEVLAFLKARLASYKLPRRILIVSAEDLNLTGTAKIKPAQARELAARLIRSADEKENGV